MSGFFSEKLKSDATDLAIVRGVIAEQEGKLPDEIKLVFDSNEKKENITSNEIEDLFR